MLHPANAPAGPGIAHSIPQMLPCCTRDPPQFTPSNIPVGPGTHLLHSSNASAGAGTLHPAISPCLTWDCPTPDPKISHAGCLIPPKHPTVGQESPRSLYPPGFGGFQRFPSEGTACQEKGCYTAQRYQSSLPSRIKVCGEQELLAQEPGRGQKLG